VRVATSPAFLEGVANDPRVRPHIGPGTHRFEAGESWARTVALEWDTGGIVFLREAEGVYSGHWVFLPKTPDVIGKARAALAYLFANTNANAVIGQTPVHLKHALRAAKAAGMRHLFTCDGIAHSAMTRQDWLTKEGT
jgi:hypothetical protein